MTRLHRRRRQNHHDDNPRTRLLELGPTALSDVELVEILLRNGCPGSSAGNSLVSC